MGDNVGVTCFFGHVDGLKRLGQGANLVELNQNRIRHTTVDALLQNLSVGDKQIVANQLHLTTNTIRQRLPAVPIRLIHAVFHRNDGETVTEVGEIVDKGSRIVALSFASQIVLPVHIKF